MRRISCMLLLLCLASFIFAAEKLEPANLTLAVYQRIFPPQKQVSVSLDSYNLRSVDLRIYPTTIETLIPNAAVLEASDDRKNPNSVAGRLAKMQLGAPVKTLAVVVKDFYPNQWRQRTVKLPLFAPGVYVVEAAGGGVTKRTWLAISSSALLVKRSPDVATAWLVNATTGKPLANVPLASYDANGKLQTVRTGTDGLAGFKVPMSRGRLWVAAQTGEPAFARASAPEPEKPYQVYMYTDRPIYRPGQQVNFHGTVRAVSRGQYALPKNGEVRVQIKTRGDTVVYDERLPLDTFGGFSGNFQLAPEPPLGSYNLEVAIGDFREYTGFEVESYRKPDFEVAINTPGAHAVGSGQTIPVTISANYFFGSPVARGKVSYEVQFQGMQTFLPDDMLAAPGLGLGNMRAIEPPFSGEGQLDAGGKLIIQVPTLRSPYNREMTIQAKVTDLSLRTRSATGSMMLTGAAFQLQLEPSQQNYQPGQTAKIAVIARDYDDKPVVAEVTVTLIEHLVDREGHGYAQRTPQTVTTGKDGRAIASFKLVRPGDYELEARAHDAEKNPVAAASELYVTVEKQQQWPALELLTDRNQYAPGDSAKLCIRTNQPGSSALLTVEGERLYKTQVITLTKNETVVMLPVAREYLRGVELHLTTIRDGSTYNAYSRLNVPPLDRQLLVTVTPDKPTYQPGETATFTVATLDKQGRGVPAEVSVGVVDTALYAIREDRTPDPFGVFWGQQRNRIETDFSLAASYPGGAFQQIPGGDESAAGARIRKQFEDTAYWAPAVQTDAQGKATVSFTMPDNLTTWRTTARGLTGETQAGQTRQEVTAKLPLMARLVLPRFYIKDDQAISAALIHNYTGADRDVRITLSAEGAQVQGEPSQIIHMRAGDITRVTWKVLVSGITGNADGDTARFLISADGGDGAADAMQSTVPVYPDGVRRVDAQAGVVQGAGKETVTVTLPNEAVANSAKLEMTLSPSLAGPIFEALDYLIGYPHGCAEQTMDRFLPDIIVTRTLKELGVQRPVDPMLPRYVSFGIQKLLRFQHQDGGWQWWENDESEPFMTAYIVYGLAMARDAGYPLAAGPLPRGVNYLTERIHATTAQRGDITPDEATYLLWALASAGVWDQQSWQWAVTVAKTLIGEQDKLDTFSRASLALALRQMSKEKNAPAGFATASDSLAAQLEKEAIITGSASHWTIHAAGCGFWLDSDVEVTAQVLQALLAVRPQSPQIVPAVRWLMAARQGKSWNSTKDTAAAVLALTAYLKGAKELAPEGSIVVRIGGREVKRYDVKPADAFTPAVMVTIPAADLQPGANAVEIEHAGQGNLYWTARLSYTIPVAQAVPLTRGIALSRTFHVSADDPITANRQGTGEMIAVEIHVNADQDYRYVMVQEPIPAGCEIVAGGDADAPQSSDWQQVWDNRIVYYLDELSKGETTLTYWLQTESPGAFNIPPSTAELMYFPEVRGEGKAAHLQVVE